MGAGGGMPIRPIAGDIPVTTPASASTGVLASASRRPSISVPSTGRASGWWSSIIIIIPASISAPAERWPAITGLRTGVMTRITAVACSIVIGCRTRDWSSSARARPGVRTRDSVRWSISVAGPRAVETSSICAQHRKAGHKGRDERSLPDHALPRPTPALDALSLSRMQRIPGHCDKPRASVRRDRWLGRHSARDQHRQALVTARSEWFPVVPRPGSIARTLPLARSPDPAVDRVVNPSRRGARGFPAQSIRPV